MPTTDDRIWSRDGRSLRGVAPGRRDVRMAFVPVPGDGPALTTQERDALLDSLADIHNGLNPAQQQVMRHLRTASATDGWQLTSGELARLTGFTTTYMGLVLDQLQEMGYLERPEKGTAVRRPVRLAEAREGAKR